MLTARPDVWYRERYRMHPSLSLWPYSMTGLPDNHSNTCTVYLKASPWLQVASILDKMCSGMYSSSLFHSQAAAIKLILPVFHSNPQSLTNVDPSVVYMFAYLACNIVETESGALSLTGFSIFIIIYEIGARYLCHWHKWRNKAEMPSSIF